jgi:hypothetical protein
MSPPWGKSAAGPGLHDRADLGIGGKTSHRLGKFPAQLFIEGVQARRTVQGKDGNAVLDLV